MMRNSLASLGVIMTLVAAYAVSGKPMAPGRRPSNPQARHSVVTAKKDGSSTPNVDEKLRNQKAERFMMERGTSISADPKAEGENLAFQQKFARQLSKMNFIPHDRTTHFQWLNNFDGIFVRGWRGMISDVTKTDGGLVVDVLVTPDLQTQRHNITHTSDYYTEKYLFTNGSVDYLGGAHSADAKPAIIHE